MDSFFKKIFLTLLLVVSVVAEVHSSQYRIATVAWIGWSPLHVASQKGFWDELGVDVAVVDYDDPIVILEAIKAGKIDFAMDMVGSLVGIYMKGEPVAVIAETNWSHGGDKIIVQKGGSLVNHKNGVLGVFLKQPSCLFFLDKYLQEIHLQLSDFRIVQINSYDLAAQFIAGRLPAIVNYEPWANDAVKNGNGEVLATSADYNGCIPECLWGYKQRIETIPKQDIHNILRGWIKAVGWLQNPAHKKAYYKILRKKTFQTNTDLSATEFSNMLSNVKIHNANELYERNKLGGGLYKYLNALKLFLEKNDMMDKQFLPEDIFDNRYIRHVLEND